MSTPPMVPISNSLSPKRPPNFLQGRDAWAENRNIGPFIAAHLELSLLSGASARQFEHNRRGQLSAFDSINELAGGASRPIADAPKIQTRLVYIIKCHQGWTNAVPELSNVRQNRPVKTAIVAKIIVNHY